MQTSIRVESGNRDALSRIAEEDMGGVSLDEALARVLWEYAALRDIHRLEADPGGLAAYRAQAAELADVDTRVVE